MTEHCPACRSVREGTDAFCGACGRRFDAPVTAADTMESPSRIVSATPDRAAEGEPADADVATGPGTDLRVFPWWQIISFGILSLGARSFYWFYCTRKQLNHLLRISGGRPGLDTFGYAVPVWQGWSVNGIFRDVGRLARATKTGDINNTTYTVLWCVFYYVPIANYLSVIVIPILYVNTQIQLSRSLGLLSGGTASTRPLTIWSAIWGTWAVAAFVLYWALA